MSGARPSVPEVPLVSVIIPTHERREPLRRALASLARQSVPGEQYEVVVSVDRSEDGTRDMLASSAVPYELRVTDARHPGRAAACNAALEFARGDVIVILDDDMQVVPEFVSRHARHHPPGSRNCVLGAVPISRSSSSPLVVRYMQAKFAEHLAKLAESGHTYVPRDFYTGNASLRAEVLRSLGGFNSAFTAYGNEDVELFVRLRESGVDIQFDATALAWQEYGTDLRGLAGDTLAKGATAVKLARIHPTVFKDLRLAAPQEHSRPWLIARAVLLSCTRRFPGLSKAIFGLATACERAGFWRSPSFYRAVLDYGFWAGVDAELDHSRDQGELVKLATNLHRGPIDLLLHG
jgi:glycosyltransferase involved in cell wall biosynthesis